MTDGDEGLNVILELFPNVSWRKIMFSLNEDNEIIISK